MDNLKDPLFSDEKNLYIFDEKAQDELTKLKPWTKEYLNLLSIGKCILKKYTFLHLLQLK